MAQVFEDGSMKIYFSKYAYKQEMFIRTQTQAPYQIFCEIIFNIQDILTLQMLRLLSS